MNNPNKKSLIFASVIAVLSLLTVGYVYWAHPEIRPFSTTVAEAKPAPTPVKEAPAPTAPAQASAPATAASIDKSSPYNQLQELTNENKDSLLFQRSGQVSLVIVYDSRLDADFQRKQVQIMVDQLPNYSGKVEFYRFDLSKPNAGQLWQILTRRPLTQFDGGPCYILVALATTPNATNRSIALVDMFGDRLELTHSLNATRLQYEIYNSTHVVPNDYTPPANTAPAPAGASEAPKQ